MERKTVLALVCILAIAAALRLVYLDRLPPGLSYDEAYNDLIATRMTLLPPPAYIPADFGKEPAHMVIIALLYKLTGQPFAEGGRAASALVGIFNIGALFLATREMFRHSANENEATTIGLLAAGALTILYWHVHFSRVGMEHVLVPAFSTAAFYFFWLALNQRKRILFAPAGGLLGLCLYTYPSAYMLPFVILLYWVWRWLTQRNTFKSEIGHALMYGAGALLVFAPHIIYFVQHPEWFMARPMQVAGVKGSAWYVPLQNLVRMAGGLVWRGDTNLRLNLPGRPALDIAQSVALVVGVWYGLERIRNARAIFILIWLIVMLLPSVFSDMAPHFGRALGATPPLAILIALGLTRAARLPGAGYILVALALLYSGAQTAYDYFHVWANHPDQFTAFEVGLRQTSEYLATLPQEDILSLSPTPRDAPIFGFYLGGRGDKFKTFNGRRCAVFPYQPANDFIHAAIEADERRSLAALQAAFPSGQIVHEITDRGSRYAAIYHVPAGTRAQIALDPQATFAAAIELAQPAGLERAALEPGATLALTLTWRALETLNANYTSFVHLARQAGEPPLAQEDTQPCDNSYPTTWWSPGEIIVELRLIHLPPALPPGDYILAAGWYDLNTGQRLPVSAGGDSIIIAAVHIK